jgi:hypothetical protein
MSSRTILIETDAVGAFSYEEPLFCSVVAVKTVVGDLDTPDIVISDGETGDVLRTLTALAANDYWQPGNPIAVFGLLHVDVTGGGDTKHGRIRFLLET